jgi:hypothetical protein
MNDQEVGSFVLCLMAFDGGEMARHYWVICDHKILIVVVFSKAWVS